MTTIDKQQKNSSENILQLDNYLSLQRIHGHNINFLNLDRCLIQQPYHINDIFNNEKIGGISLSNNYLLHMPTFVSNYTNLIELNISHNELNNTEFILYRPLNDSECYSNENSKNNSRPLIHPFLKIINLSFNHIKSLPTNIHYLRFLHTLNLSHNYLEELPNNIGYLAQLNTLILDNNHLKVLPNTFTRLIQLEILNLSFNHFQSIDKIKNLPNLKIISMNSNPLKTFPVLLNTCFNLEEISFSNIQLNQMNDITFDLFNQFTKLKKLDLSNNNLENNFLSSCTQQFDHLEELYLQHNQFSSIFSLISNIKSLYLLDLSYNSLTNLPECFNSNLKILHLSYNSIELNSNDCIYLKHINELDLDHNQITYLPNEFIQCLHLESLNISSNQFQKFPEIILQLRSLNKLIFNYSQLQYITSIDLIKKYFYRTLNILDLSNNNLQTNLYELTGLKALTCLDLSYNQLYELHQDFRLLTCLQIFKLNKNKFTKFPTLFYDMASDGHQKYIGKEALSDIRIYISCISFQVKLFWNYILVIIESDLFRKKLFI